MATEFDGVESGGSGLTKTSESSSRGFLDVDVAEVLEQLGSEGKPFERPGWSFFGGEDGTNPMKGVVLEVGDGKGDLCEVGGVGSRLNVEDELALEDEFESFRDLASEGSGRSDLGFSLVRGGGGVRDVIDGKGRRSRSVGLDLLKVLDFGDRLFKSILVDPFSSLGLCCLSLVAVVDELEEPFLRVGRVDRDKVGEGRRLLSLVGWLLLSIHDVSKNEDVVRMESQGSRIEGKS